MANKGFDGATVADIARAAGLAPGLVHYHFRNKLEILTALIDQLAARHAARLQRGLTDAGSNPRTRLDTFIDLHLSLEGAAPDAVAAWTLIAGEALRSVPVREAFRRGVESARAPLVAIIQHGIDSGHFSVRDARASAGAVLALIQGYLALAATTDDLIVAGTAAVFGRRAAAGIVGAAAPKEDV